MPHYRVFFQSILGNKIVIPKTGMRAYPGFRNWDIMFMSTNTKKEYFKNPIINKNFKSTVNGKLNHFNCELQGHTHTLRQGQHVLCAYVEKEIAALFIFAMLTYDTSGQGRRKGL